MKTINQLQNMSGRYAVITGATGKLGKVISETLVELDCNLILVDLPGSNLSSLKTNLLKIRKVNKLCFFHNYLYFL